MDSSKLIDQEDITQLNFLIQKVRFVAHNGACTPDEKKQLETVFHLLNASEHRLRTLIK